MILFFSESNKYIYCGIDFFREWEKIKPKSRVTDCKCNWTHSPYSQIWLLDIKTMANQQHPYGHSMMGQQYPANTMAGQQQQQSQQQGMMANQPGMMGTQQNQQGIMGHQTQTSLPQQVLS